MNDNIEDFIEDLLKSKYNIHPRLMELGREAESEISDTFYQIDKVAEYNQLKVLHAMQKNKLSGEHLSYANGYGYTDPGRDCLEAIYRDVFNTEDSIVRPQIISGTHALSLGLFGNLSPGDQLLSPGGPLYDTIQTVIGIRKAKGSLAEYGITYNEVRLKDGDFDFKGIADAINTNTKLAIIQRSGGYGRRMPFSIDQIKAVIKHIKSINEKIICFVDNCYGEFVNIHEPTEAGADLIAGSLIKNPGGGIAQTGGYIAGKEAYVKNAASRLSSPGIGKEAGPSLGFAAQFLHGLFLAPSIVASSLKNAVFAARIFEKLGFETSPSSTDCRRDIVQSIIMRNPERVISFCKGIQAAAPVDSFVSPVPWEMPGYQNDIIMASGSFVAGSSIELSADGPIREPYAVYFQGGLTYQHGKNGLLIAINNMVQDNGLI